MEILFLDSLAPDVLQLHRLYQAESWTKVLTLNEIEKMLKNSNIVIGAVESSARSS